PRLPRRHARLPARGHVRPPARLPHRVAHRHRRARRIALHPQAHLLCGRVGGHHHRDHRRHLLPRLHPAKGSPVITLSTVLRKYTADVAIGPVDLEIPPGGITALVGPNGAGKSTLLTMIGRLMGMDAGSITVGGLDVSKTPSKELAKRISILRQENHFVTRLTVRQLVGFGRFPHSGGRLTVEDERIISEAIDFLKLDDLESRYLDELSGGQRQRAYVAMVLAQDTEYVLLDEPLNNLDMQHSVQMMKHLKRAA